MCRKTNRAPGKKQLKTSGPGGRTAKRRKKTTNRGRESERWGVTSVRETRKNVEIIGGRGKIEGHL